MKNSRSLDLTHDPAIPIFEDILTPRLDLIAVTPESLRVQQRNSEHMRAELAACIGASVPDEWPHENWEPHVFEYLLKLFVETPEAIGWCRYLALRDMSSGGRTIIGSFGSGLPKAETGEAEIGYGILPSWQRQGFAPEAITAMLPWLQTRCRFAPSSLRRFPICAAPSASSKSAASNQQASASKMAPSSFAAVPSIQLPGPDDTCKGRARMR